jgi:hypothetical protein
VQEIIFSQWKRKLKSSIGNRLFRRPQLSAVKTAEFASDRVPYIVQRGRWCNITILKVYASSEKRSDFSKDSFAEELLCSYIIIFALYQADKCVFPQIDHHGHVI